jgi:hypothetical protein
MSQQTLMPGRNGSGFRHGEQNAAAVPTCCGTTAVLAGAAAHIAPARWRGRTLRLASAVQLGIISDSPPFQCGSWSSLLTPRGEHHPVQPGGTASAAAAWRDADRGGQPLDDFAQRLRLGHPGHPDPKDRRRRRLRCSTAVAAARAGQWGPPLWISSGPPGRLVSGGGREPACSPRTGTPR